jgi:hypothetical protein
MCEVGFLEALDSSVTSEGLNAKSAATTEKGGRGPL